MNIRSRIRPLAALWAVIACACMWLTSCNDDEIKRITFVPGAELTEEGDCLVSSFSIPGDRYPGLTGSGTATISLLAPGGDDNYSYELEYDRTGDMVNCRMKMPKDRLVADNTYLVTFALADGTPTGGRLMASFADGKLTYVSAVKTSFPGLDGDGTEEAPYIISSADDFRIFLENLSADPYQGRGLCFRQNADISYPEASAFSNGKFAQPDFAGIYDGTGKSISLEDKNIDTGNFTVPRRSGIFRWLKDGAAVRDLVLRNFELRQIDGESGLLCSETEGTVMLSGLNFDKSGFITTNPGQYLGLVASVNRGKTVISGISVTGCVFAPEMSYIGTLFGENRGEAVIKDCKVTISLCFPAIEGKSYVGGLIGNSTGKVSVDGIELSQAHEGGESIVGHGNYVGGLFGKIVAPESTLDFSKGLRIKVSVNTSGSNAGAVAGYMRADLAMKNDIDVETSVKGHDYTGGLFGELHPASADRNALLDCTLPKNRKSITVEGHDYTGGFAGYCSMLSFHNDTNGEFATPLKFPSDGSFAPTVTVKVKGRNLTGGIAGQSDFCNFSGITVDAEVTGNDFTGGAVGKYCFPYSWMVGGKTQYAPALSHIVVKGHVTGEAHTAGLCGGLCEDTDLNGTNSVNGLKMHHLINYATVSGKRDTGGIAGRFQWGQLTELKWVANAGDITGEVVTGGIIGYAWSFIEYGPNDHMGNNVWDGDFNNCVNHGKIVSKAGGAAGGIIGQLDCEQVRVMKCANHGDVAGNGGSNRTGGIIGSFGHDPNGRSNSTSKEVMQCVNTGCISSDNGDSNVGGIVGYMEEGNCEYYWKGVCATIHYCYNTGEIKGNQKSDNGGILGKADNYSNLRYCMNYGRIEKGNGTVGTRKSGADVYIDCVYQVRNGAGCWQCNHEIEESDLGREESYSYFDFDKDWQISNGKAELRDCLLQYSYR